MATYKSLGLGSQGDDVKKLQTELNKNGANIAVDGSYGKETEAAVRAYQQKKGLTVDGSAGNQTQTSLYGPLTTNDTTVTNLTEAQQKYNAYNTLKEQSPVYQSTVSQADLLSMREKVLNPDKFSYDATKDPLFISYAEQARKNGQLAMEDTMGQAAALSGGFGNSYAQTVGQQVYNQHMDALDAKAVEFRDKAYAEYQDKLNTDRANLEMLTGIEESEWNRYYNESQLHNNKLDRAYQELLNAEEKEALAEQQKIEQERWNKEYQLAVDELEANNERYKNELEASKETALAQAEAESYKDTLEYEKWLAEMEQKEKSEERDAYIKLLGTDVEDIYEPDLYYDYLESFSNEMNKKNEGTDESSASRKNVSAATKASVLSELSQNGESFIKSTIGEKEYLTLGNKLSYADFIESRIAAEYYGGRMSEDDVELLLEYYGIV